MRFYVYDNRRKAEAVNIIFWNRIKGMLSGKGEKFDKDGNLQGRRADGKTYSENSKTSAWCEVLERADGNFVVAHPESVYSGLELQALISGINDPIEIEASDWWPDDIN